MDIVNTSIEILHALDSNAEWKNTSWFWRKNSKQVLVMNDELMDEIKLASTEQFSPAVFEHIPYESPMVIFQTPIKMECPEWDEIGGIYLSGFICPDGKKLLAFSGKNPDKCPKATVFFPVFSTSKGKYYSFGALPINTSLTDNTLSSKISIRDITESIISASKEMGGVKESQKRIWIDTSAICISALLYLCSKTNDSQTVPNKSVQKSFKKAKTKTVDKAPTVIKIGWETGAALSELKKKASTKSGVLTDKRYDPQHRKAHFKIVWTGAGRKIPKVVFISPYWTHKEDLENYFINKVRKVSGNEQASMGV